MSQAVPVRSARARTGPPGGGRQGKPPWRADGAGAASSAVMLRRVKRGKRGSPTGEWARLLSRLRAGATETNDYPGLHRIAERHRAGGVSYLSGQLNIRAAMPGARGGGCLPAPGAGGRSARSGPTVRPVRGGIDGRDAPIPVVGTRCSHLAGIVIRGAGKITRRWSRNDPCGSCGGDGPRRSLVAKRFRGSAQQRRWARWESVSICVCTTVWRLTRSNSTRKSSAPWPPAITRSPWKNSTRFWASARSLDEQALPAQRPLAGFAVCRSFTRGPSPRAPAIGGGRMLWCYPGRAPTPRSVAAVGDAVSDVTAALGQEPPEPPAPVWAGSSA